MSAVAPPPSDADDARLQAALWRVVAAQGWHGLTMHRLAVESGTPAARIRARVPTKLDLLRLHARLVDQEVLHGTIPGQGGAPRDRIFDVLMRRLDALQPHRAGVTRFLAEAPRDPLLALAMAPVALNSMAWMLEAAELDAGGFDGVLRTKGLFGVWLMTLRAWERDGSVDLGPSMAALDRALDQAERLARTLRLDPGEDRGGDRSGAGPDVGGLSGA